MLIESRAVKDAELALSYLVGVVDGRVVACGGWRAVEPGVAELVRLYVRPAFRGRGLARQLVVALEEEALAAGRPVVRLEAGSELTAAIGLFRSAGYRELPVPGGVRLEKTLAPDEFFVTTGVAVGWGGALRA